MAQDKTCPLSFLPILGLTRTQEPARPVSHAALSAQALANRFPAKTATGGFTLCAKESQRVGRFLMDLYGKLRNRIMPKPGPGLAELMDQLLLADAEQLGE